MANPNQKLNIVGIAINGDVLLVNGIGSLQLGGFDRESEQGDDGFYYKQTIKQFRVELNIIFNADTSIAKYRKIEDAVVNLTLDTGQTYTATNAWVESCDEISKDDGTFTLVLASKQQAEEVK